MNVRVGGFYRAPLRRELHALIEPLQRALDIALSTVRFVSNLDFPDCERDYEFVSLGAAGEYPFNAGHVVSSKGLDITPQQYEVHFDELHVKRSNALHSHLHGKPYLTGPMARYSLNSSLLSSLAREAAKTAGLGETCTNPFRSIVVRAVEVVYACDEALRIITVLPGAGGIPSRAESPRSCWLSMHRGAPRDAVSPLSAGRRRHDHGG